MAQRFSPQDRARPTPVPPSPTVLTRNSGPAPSDRAVTADIRRRIADDGLTSPSATDSVLRLATMVAAYTAAALVAWQADAIAVWLLFWVFGGLVLASMLIAEHEAIHASLFRSSSANHVVGALLGAITGAPYAAYRAYHFEHHRRTHQAGDPEPAVVVRSRFAYLGTMVVLIPAFCAGLWRDLLAAVAGHPPAHVRRVRRRGVEVLSLVATAAVLAALATLWAVAGWWAVVAVWGGPLAASFVWGAVFAVPEHYEAAYGPAPVLETTRTIDAGTPTRWLLWNAGYHAAHHLVPAVPGRNLARLQELLDDQVTIRSTSYGSYHLGLWRRLGRGEFAAAPPWTADSPTD